MTKKRILIVEDEPIIAMDNERVVRNLGYEVAGIALSGEVAVQRAGEDNRACKGILGNSINRSTFHELGGLPFRRKRSPGWAVVIGMVTFCNSTAFAVRTGDVKNNASLAWVPSGHQRLDGFEAQDRIETLRRLSAQLQGSYLETTDIGIAGQSDWIKDRVFLGDMTCPCLGKSHGIVHGNGTSGRRGGGHLAARKPPGGHARNTSCQCAQPST
jgi:CheY-like chemotaxis protein